MESIVQALASRNDKFLLDLRDPDLCPVQTVSLLSQASFHQPLVCYLWWWHLWVGQCLVTQSHLSLCSPMNWSPPGSSVLADSPGKNNGVGCHALLQRIFPIQGWNPGLLHCRWILYQLNHQGSLMAPLLWCYIYPTCPGSGLPVPSTM